MISSPLLSGLAYANDIFDESFQLLDDLGSNGLVLTPKNQCHNDFNTYSIEKLANQQKEIIFQETGNSPSKRYDGCFDEEFCKKAIEECLIPIQRKMSLGLSHVSID